MTDLLSLPKDRIRALLLEGVNDSAVNLIRAAGYTNLTYLKTALDEDALREALQGGHLLAGC
jgi:D-3-phosphoglycerate dehydrogenase